MQLSNEPFYFQPEGQAKEAFLMLHGLGGGVYEMRPLAEKLVAQGYAVAGFNYPGHDQPATRMPASTWQQWYEQVDAHYRKLTSHYERVSVIGFSTGCMLALHLGALMASKMPLHRLILLSPFLKIRMEWYYLLQPERYVNSIGHVIRHVPRWGLPISDPEMHDLAMKAAYFKTFNLASVRSALELIRKVDHEIEAVTCPTLIVQSRQDRVVCPTGASMLMERLPAVQKELIWLDNCDHVILLDRERDIVASRILEFLATTPDEPFAVEEHVKA